MPRLSLVAAPAENRDARVTFCGSVWPDGGERPSVRLRLARHRLRLRRQRVRPAAGREGLPGRRARVRQTLRATRTSRARPGACADTSGRRGWGCAGIMRLSTFKDVADRQPAAASAAAASATRTRSTCRRRRSSRTRSGASSPTGSASSRRTTPRRSGMLGVVDARPTTTRPTSCCSELGERPRRRRHVQQDAASAIFFGERRARPCLTPTSAARGPTAPAASRCGRCMVGCPLGAKNTLVKNYLWLAERRGVQVTPDRTVVDIRPLGAEDGSDGYARHERRLRHAARPRPPHAHARAAWSSPPARSARTDCCSAAG